MRWKRKDPQRIKTGFALFPVTLHDGTVILWERFHYRECSLGRSIKYWAWGTEEPILNRKSSKPHSKPPRPSL